MGILLVSILTVGFVLLTFSFADAVFAPSFAVFVFEYGYFIIFGLVVYLFFRQRRQRRLPELPDAGFPALSIVFITLLGGALLSVVDSLYERPLAYYVLFAAAVTVILVQTIGFDPKLGRRRHIILLEALSIPLLNNFTFNRVQPYLFGADSTWHMNAAAEIASTGGMPAWMGVYLTYPWFHFWAAETMVVTGTVIVAFVSATFLHAVIALLASYLILRQLTTERTALVGSLFVLASSTFMTSGLEYVPVKSGMAILLFAFWIAIRASGDWRFWGIYLLLFPAAFLYHPVFGFLLVMISLAGVLASQSTAIANSLNSFRLRLKPRARSVPPIRAQPLKATPIIAPFLFSIVVFVGYLLYISPDIFQESIRALTFPDDQLGALGTIRGATPTSPFIFQSMLSSLGITAVLILVVPILLSWAREAKDHARRFFIYSYLAILSSVSLIVVGDLFLLGPARFLATLDLFAAMAAGPGLILVLTRVRLSRKHLFVVAALFFGLVMVSALSYRTDANTHLSPNIPTGLGYLQQDVVAVAQFLQPRATAETTISLDGYMMYWIANFPERSPFSLYNNPILPTNIHDVISVPEGVVGLYILNARSADRGGWDLLAMETRLLLSPQIYDGGNIRILALS